MTRNVSNGDEELTPVPFSIKEKIDKELDRLEQSQIIEKVNASDWSTPLVTVIKSNGELRLCGDFKNTLNICIEDEKYPLPTIETRLGNLGGNKIFTKLDLSSAYHQFEMDEASKNLLVVSTHRGLYRYNRLPFGISPASAIFQRCMDSLFHDVPNMVIYLDDIFIGSKDEQEHYRILKMIFDKLKELNFTLNKEKCLFLKKKDICFLGHIINEDGVRPDSKKLEALERCKKPFDKTSLKSFLGMLSFYSKYIPNMSTLAGPLYQLLKKDNRWKWSSQCEKAFLNLKLTLLNSQALIHYSMKLPLTLTCDASAYGISGILCHIVEGEEKPITFVSRTLSSAEAKYSQTEKEALAIVFATSKLRQYLFGRKFVLKSDHKALTTVFGNKRLLPPLIANRLHRYGLPQCLVSDNSPPFNSIEFKEFLRKNNVYHLTSPAYNPSSNGIAEVSIYGLCTQVYKYVYKLFANCVANLPFRSQAAPLAVKMGVEAQFKINNITTEETKFNYLVSQLDPKYVENIWDIVSSESKTKFADSKARLLNWFKESENARIKRLITGVELGNMKPSQLLQKLRAIATPDISEKLIRTLWLDKLPDSFKAILLVSDEDVDKLAAMADKITDKTTKSEIYDINHDTNKVLLDKISELSNAKSHKSMSTITQEEITDNRIRRELDPEADLTVVSTQMENYVIIIIALEKNAYI
ncbi:K02A2.6-like [Cordylochernes scorpioides]|uniref:K02A2.6-like n=1 Tax=Cordylochernes scorpioides TaxID=51811 RepID=A0ABY6JWE9_9ARAC|nr:K02A2.6-like [Cordylochernes scorpioides]